MMISENCMDFRDDVYHAISKHTGLSKKQIAKLEDFRESCKGPFMVPGYQFCDNGANYIASREFDWCDYDVYEAEGYVFIQYNTRVQGDSDCVVKMAKDNSSVKPKAQRCLPDVSLGKYFSFCSFVP